MHPPPPPNPARSQNNRSASLPCAVSFSPTDLVDEHAEAVARLEEAPGLGHAAAPDADQVEAHVSVQRHFRQVPVATTPRVRRRAAT